MAITTMGKASALSRLYVNQPIPLPPSSKIVPPDPPLLRPSRLGTTIPAACSAAKNAPAFSRNSSRLINDAKKSSDCPTWTGYSTVVFRFASSRRSQSGLSTGFTSRISPKKIILPDSLPLYFSRSFSSFASIQIAPPLRTVTRRRPRQRLCDKNGRIRGRHAHPCIQLPPAHAELAPVFEVGIRASHGRELIARPLVGLFEIRRSRQSRPDSIRESRSKLHHMRVLQALVTNALVHREVEILHRRLRQVVRGPARFICLRVL